MNILVCTCHASILLSLVCARPNHEEHTKVHGHRTHHRDEIITKPPGYRYDHRKTTKFTKSEEEERARKRAKILAKFDEEKPEYWRFKDALTLSEQLARRPLNPNSCRREYVNSKNYTRRSILPEYLMCDSLPERYNRKEKEALASLERRFAREKKEREEKERGKTTIHPLFRTPSNKYHFKSTTTESLEIYTASSRILHEMAAEHDRIVTGDSAHYDKENYDYYVNNPHSEDKSISSDYHEFETMYDSIMAHPNRTTPYYQWWSYDPNQSYVTHDNGFPLDYNRALYSLKMSSLLPHNFSAEVEAHYNQKSDIDWEYADKCEKSMQGWAKTLSSEYNSYAGPVTLRRNLIDPLEIVQNRIDDVEYEFQEKMFKDVKNYLITPALKGLYHFKKWMNPKFSTTTRKVALTWPNSMDSEARIYHYKKYLREEENITVPDSAGRSIFEKYTFTADSNYYDEDTGDLPFYTQNPY